MNDGRVLLTDHDLVALGGGLHQEIGPGQEELTRVRATGHTEDDSNHIIVKWIILFNYINGSTWMGMGRIVGDCNHDNH